MFLPIIVIKIVLREKLKDFGLNFKKQGKYLLVFLILYLFMLPFLIISSFSPAFKNNYPFYEYASRSLFDFIFYEAWYMFQFFTLEFFFRGFILHALKKRLVYIVYLLWLFHMY